MLRLAIAFEMIEWGEVLKWFSVKISEIYNVL